MADDKTQASDAWVFPPPVEAEPEPEPAASMALTRAELLERLQKLEDAEHEGLTKAEMLERIQIFESGESGENMQKAYRGLKGEVLGGTDTVSRSTLAAMPGPVAVTDEVATASINGVTYSWQGEPGDDIPEEARAVWARYKAANS